MAASPGIRSIHVTFERHERRYCIFSLKSSDEDLLYYSHQSRPLRSLMHGKDFTGQLPELMKNGDLCIECGLGLSIQGGVALDNGDLLAWNCTVEEANAILVALKESLGENGDWIMLF